MASFSDLPDEVKAVILKTSDPKELLKLCEINSDFKILCKNDIFWRDITLNKFGNVDPKGYGLRPDKFNNSWFDTCKFFYKYSKVYTVSKSLDLSCAVVGIYRSFDNAFLSMIDHITKIPCLAGDFFLDNFTNKYPEFDHINFRYNEQNLLSKTDHDNFVDKFKKEIDSYMRKIQKEVSKDNFEYEVNYCEYFNISLLDINP